MGRKPLGKPVEVGRKACWWEGTPKETLLRSEGKPVGGNETLLVYGKETLLVGRKPWRKEGDSRDWKEARGGEIIFLLVKKTVGGGKKTFVDVG